MKYGVVFFHLLGFLGLAGAGAVCGAGEAPPNFVIALTDDQGYGDLGCFGATDFKTPHIDRMAAEGIKLTNFYVQPACGVSRAALLTGSYPIRLAEPRNRKNAHPIIHAKEITFARLLRDAGYATALVGKWHLAGGYHRDGYDPENMPNHHGFDYSYGTPLYNGFTAQVRHEGPGSFRTHIMRNGEMLIDALTQEQMNALTQDDTREAIRFIRENRDQPFFLYLSHNMPHVPLGASETFRGTSERGLYGDVIQELDWSTGQVLPSHGDA